MVDIGIRGSPWNESNTRQILEVSHDPENSAEQLNILYKASLERTCHHIAANYADYTAWYFRRKALVHLGLVDKQELSYVITILHSDMKNYQAWYHREWLMRSISAEAAKECLPSELLDTEEQLEMDSKNHNAWQYRQFLVSHFKLSVEEEYEFIEAMILADCRNNSAWSYRFWLTTFTEPSLQEGIRKRETKCVAKWLTRFPENESLWNYLLSDPIDKEGKKTSLTEMHAKGLEAIEEIGTRSVFSAEALAKIRWANKKYDEARQIYDHLIQTHRMHEEYYRFRLTRLDFDAIPTEKIG